MLLGTIMNSISITSVLLVCSVATLCTAVAVKKPPSSTRQPHQEATTATTTREETSTMSDSALLESLQDRPQLVQDAFRNNQTLFYFGLGSNMLRSKVVGRSSDGDIEIKEMEAAVVHGHRLAFNMKGFPPLEPGMGSLEPISASSQALHSYHSAECHGALIELTPTMYARVMKSEGVGNSNTTASTADTGYEEIVVTAVPYNTLKPPVQAIALRARPASRIQKDPSPSQRYMKILREGAAELQLKPCYQEFLAEHPVQQVPKWIKRIAIYNLMFTFSINKRKLFGWSTQVQRWCLWKVYSPSTTTTTNPTETGAVRKVVSDGIMAAILLPGAVGGISFSFINKLRKKEPSPFLKRFLTLLDDDERDDTEKEEEKEKEL